MNGLVTAFLTALSITSSLLLPHPPAPPANEAPARASAVAAWPLSPRPEVVAAFAPPVRRWEHGHRGVDLLGRAGQDVRATLPGTVSFAGQVAGRGVVVVDHAGRRTTYEPVTATARVGDAVGNGEVIGTLQHALGHCAPRVCLHWGLIVGDGYQDPLDLVGAGPVRLLPVPRGLPGSTR